MRSAFAGVAILCLLPAVAHSQRLYRKDMDAAAQAAVRAMEKVDSKDLFKNMLDNVSTQSKQDYETTFSGIKRTTRSRIQEWDVWCTVHNDLVLVMKTLGYPGVPRHGLQLDPEKNKTPEAFEGDLRKQCTELLILKTDAKETDATKKQWTDELAKIKDAKGVIDDALTALKSKPPATDSLLANLFSQVGDLSEAEAALNEIKTSAHGSKLEALAGPASEAVGILKRLGDAYHDYQQRVDDINKVKQELRDLQAEMLNIALRKLMAEEEHLQRLLSIEARRAHELEDAATSFEEYRRTLMCEGLRNPGLDLKRIDESLRELGQTAATDKSAGLEYYRYTAEERQLLGGTEEEHLKFCEVKTQPVRLRIEALSRALFQAAAVQDRGATPELFAQLRRAQEQQRYSIVISSLEARSYETLVNTGVRRLAMLHAGGIKPEQIAQLIYQAGQLTGVSVIAFKQ